jgi:hypothetical protein
MAAVITLVLFIYISNTLVCFLLRDIRQFYSVSRHDRMKRDPLENNNGT